MFEVLHGVIKISPRIYNFFVGMPRKFRLSVHRKNEFRKCPAKRIDQESDPALLVSIPSKSVSVLKVALPLEIYLQTPVSTISQLQQRWKVMPVLPHGSHDGVWYAVYCLIQCNVYNIGWIEVPAESTGEMFFSKMNKEDGDLQLVCSVVIHQDLVWHVCVKGQKLTTCSPPLSSLPQVISSVADVRDLLKFIHSCDICSGNSDEKYAPLVASRKGNFMNASGLLLIMVCFNHNYT